jgi:hypothetical protein
VGWPANVIRTNTEWISTFIIESRGQSSPKRPIKTSRMPTSAEFTDGLCGLSQTTRTVSNPTTSTV